MTPDDEHDDAFINYVGDLVNRVHDLEAAMDYIRENLGRVCADFTVCDHDACRSSCAAWLVADLALRNEYTDLPDDLPEELAQSSGQGDGGDRTGVDSADGSGRARPTLTVVSG